MDSVWILRRMAASRCHSIDESQKSGQSGFALDPAILMLVTLLATVGLFIILQGYVERSITANEITRVRAGYATQSGVAAYILSPRSGIGAIRTHEFTYDDCSKATASADAWGALLLVRVEGRFGKGSVVKSAFSWENPSGSISWRTYLACSSGWLDSCLCDKFLL